MAAVSESELQNAPAPPDPDKEIAACALDGAYFTHTYLWLDSPHGDGVAVAPFKLWPAQARLLWRFYIDRMIVILKARQLGISWLCCAYVLHVMLFEAGKVVLAFSKGQREANELIRRVAAMYHRLPNWMTNKLPKLVKHNNDELEWDNGSRMNSMPATKGSGRTFTASCVLMDEAAWQMFGSEVYTGVMPTMADGGQMIMLSTANGYDDLFEPTWDRAVKRLSSFKAYFLSWRDRPDRDQAWYETTYANSTEPAQFKQEYPSNPREAFLMSGNARFEGWWLDAQEPNVELPLERYDVPEALRHLLDDGLQLYRPRRPRRRYMIAADLAEGLEHGDANHAVIYDVATWEEVGNLNNNDEPDTFADQVAVLCAYFNCHVYPERNKDGGTFIARMKRMAPRYLGRGPDGKFGWLTNQVSKPDMINLLAGALRDTAVTIHDEAALQEMRIYRTLANGKTSAPKGKNDDRVMAHAIAAAMLTRGIRTGHAVSASTSGPARRRYIPR